MLMFHAEVSITAKPAKLKLEGLELAQVHGSSKFTDKIRVVFIWLLTDE